MMFIALTIVSCLRMVGIVLAISLLTLPQMTANLFTHSFKKIIWWSVITGYAGCSSRCTLEQGLTRAAQLDCDKTYMPFWGEKMIWDVEDNETMLEFMSERLLEVFTVETAKNGTQSVPLHW